uniref:Protrudin n=1 Tax=Leptobrachium leishanense TaxID=445787 RepID=A0A8C5MHN1_9ANUR
MQPTERDAASMGGTSWSEGSSTMSDSQAESPQSTTKPQTFDLFNLVVLSKRIEMYLEPVRDTWDGIKYLLRWEMPIFSICTCITLNVLLLTLNEVAWFSVGALFISIPALIGYLQEMSKVHLSEPDLARRKYYSVRREELKKVKVSRQEAVAEFKSFLIHLESILNLICGNCEKVYQVLYWQDPSASAQFYGVLPGSVCILYLLPLCWVLAIINSTIFLKNSDFYRVVSEYKASLQQKSSTENTPLNPLQDAQDADSGSSSDRSPTPLPTTSEEEDDVSQGTVEYDLNLQDNGFLSKNEVLKSKVSKLTEKLRKRYPANNIGIKKSMEASGSRADVRK